MSKGVESLRRIVVVSATLAALFGGAVSAQAPTEVPLEFIGGRLIVPVRADDGRELSFILSTASMTTVLSASAARGLGPGATLFLGGLPIPMDGRQAVPDASLAAAHRVIDGILPTPMLNGFDLLVDVAGGRLVLKPSGPRVTWPGVALTDPVRLRVYHGVVLGLDVAVNGRPYPAMLELGTPGVLVNERVVSEAGVTNGRGVLRVGDADFSGVSLRVSDHQAITRFSPNGDGFVVVGAALAEGCVLSVSWIHRELRTCVR